MVVSEIFDIKFDKKLEKHDILKFFEEIKIKPVKWYISGIRENKIKIFASFEKKPL